MVIKTKENNRNNENRLEAKKRIVYFDILNIIAIIAVIAMHCNGIVHSNPNVRAWNTSLAIDCICYFAVPVFCMLSGANLMKYREKYDTKTFFKKRVTKVLIPFVFWAIFMFVWKVVTKQMGLEQFGNIKDWINAFFNNKEEATYYFMFEILGIYLTMPLLSLLAKEENRKTLWLTVLLFFVLNSFIPNILGLAGIQYNNSLSVRIGGYIIFVLLGYLLSTQDIEKKYRILIYIGAIIGLIYKYGTTFVLSKEAGQVIKTTWGSYSSWHSILLSCSVFLIIKNLNVEKILQGKEKIVKVLTTVSSCSFGIYLIHKIVMHYEIALLNISTYSWQWRTIGAITTYLISLTIVCIFKKVPVAKKIVP